MMNLQVNMGLICCQTRASSCMLISLGLILVLLSRHLVISCSNPRSLKEKFLPKQLDIQKALLDKVFGQRLTLLLPSLFGVTQTPNTRRLVTGYVVHFGEYLISWKSKNYHTMSKSLTKTECRSMALAVVEITWLVGLFQEPNVPITLSISVFSGSNSSIQLADNLVFHE